jgi:thiol-disulfide isomerase/thioredoxin
MVRCVAAFVVLGCFFLVACQAKVEGKPEQKASETSKAKPTPVAPKAPPAVTETKPAEPVPPAPAISKEPVVQTGHEADAAESPAADAEKKETSADLAMKELDAVLNREAQSKEELITNIKDAVAAAEKVNADTTATEDQKLQATNAFLDIVAQGEAEGIEGFREKLKAAYEKIKAEPGNVHLPKATYHVFRIDSFDVDGKPTPEAMSLAEKLLAEFPEQKGIATRLLQEIGAAAESVDDIPLALKAYDMIIDKFGDSRAAQMVAADRKRLQAINNPFTFEGSLLSGEKLDPEQLKGKVVIVDFWATWCGPCIAELPNLKKLYEDYHDKGLEVVGISLDEEKAELDAFVQEREIKWIQTFPADGESTGWEHKLADKYGVTGIPAMFLVDRTGKLVATNLRGPKLEERVKQLIEATP